MPEQYNHIKTLWYIYKEININNGSIEVISNAHDFLTNPFTTCTDSLLTMCESPAKDFESYGNDHTISYYGIRIEPNNSLSGVTLPFYKECFVITRPEGTLTGVAVYPDGGNTDTTTVDRTSWTVTGGTGIYKHANFVQITYDNSGERFGHPFGRKIRIFKVVNVEE